MRAEAQTVGAPALPVGTLRDAGAHGSAVAAGASLVRGLQPWGLRTNLAAPDPSRRPMPVYERRGNSSAVVRNSVACAPMPVARPDSTRDFSAPAKLRVPERAPAPMPTDRRLTCG